jgi:hypothetical protein
VSLLLAAQPPAPAFAQGEPPNWPEYLALPFRPGLFWADVGLSVIYDTNFELTREALGGPGLQADLRAQLRTDAVRAFARVEYRGEVRQFNASERWNRDTHVLQAVLEQRVGPVGLEGIGTWQLSSHTEDREVADVYSVWARVTVRSRAAWARGYGRYWARRFELDPARGEVIRTGGADVGWRPLRPVELQVGGRYESAESEDPYRRWTRRYLSGSCRLAVGSRTTFTLEASRATRRYPDRTIDHAGRAVPLEDERWVPAAYLQVGGWQGPQLKVGYEFELRRSNDPLRELDAHRASLGLRVPVLNWRGTPAP